MTSHRFRVTDVDRSVRRREDLRRRGCGAFRGMSLLAAATIGVRAVPSIADPGNSLSISERSHLVIEAPGPGKTTRVPPALAPISDGEVLVLEPRRLCRTPGRRFRRSERASPSAPRWLPGAIREVAVPGLAFRFLTEGVAHPQAAFGPWLHRELRGADEFTSATWRAISHWRCSPPARTRPRSAL